MKNNFNVDKILIVNPIGRSGSLFLQSLFDGRSDILMFPSMFNFYDHWVVFHSTIKNPNLAQLIDSYIHDSKLSYYFDRYSDFRTYVDENGERKKLDVDKDQFLKFVRQLLLDEKIEYPTSGQFIRILHLAFYKTMGWPTSECNTILLHEHISEFSHFEFSHPLQDFENVYHLMMVRDPRNSYASYLKFNQDNNSLLKAQVMDVLSHLCTCDSFQKAIEFEKQYPGKVLYIKTEELNSDPENYMRKLCQKINVTYTDSLLVSSYAGRRQGSLSAFNKNQSGFDKGVAESKRWINLCSSQEIALIQGVYAPIFEKFKYPLEGPANSVLAILLPDFAMLKVRFKRPNDRLKYILFGGFIIRRIGILLAWNRLHCTGIVDKLLTRLYLGLISKKVRRVYARNA